jgi:hypothetical protein
MAATVPNLEPPLATGLSEWQPRSPLNEILNSLCLVFSCDLAFTVANEPQSYIQARYASSSLSPIRWKPMPGRGAVSLSMRPFSCRWPSMILFKYKVVMDHLSQLQHTIKLSITVSGYQLIRWCRTLRQGIWNDSRCKHIAGVREIRSTVMYCMVRD